MTNPDVELIGSGEEGFQGKVVPVHSAVGEMTPVRIRSAMNNACDGRGRFWTGSPVRSGGKLP